MTKTIATLLLASTLGVAPARADRAAVAALKARLDGGGRARSVSGSYGSVGLIVLDARDTRSFAAPARRKIVTAAVSGFGDVAGYVLRKSGAPVCSFYGVTDGVCLTLAGCVTGTVCD